MTKKTIIAAAVLLLAAALFVGAGAAEVTTVTVNSANELASALGTVNTDVSVSENTVKLLKDIELSGKKLIVSTGNTDVVTLDLGGKTLKTTEKSAFTVYNAKLKITNGTITADDGNYAVIIWVQGDQTSGSSVKTELEIDSDATVGTDPNADYYSIGIPSSDTTIASGITITVKGKLFGEEGVYINGTVSNFNGEDADIPVINIEGAEITSSDLAIYAAGQGKWTISNSEITGATGIYAKAGIITVSGGKVTGNGVFAGPKPNGNGADSTGDAIIIDASAGYAGNVELTVSNGAKVTSTNGYAIQDTLTNMAESATHSLTISSGEFSGGKDAITTSQAFKEAKSSGSVSATITGGTFHTNNAASELTVLGATDVTVLNVVDEQKSGQTEVLFTTASEYSLIIPPKLNLQNGKILKATVELDVITAPATGKSIDVTITSTEVQTDSDFKLVLAGSDAFGLYNICKDTAFSTLVKKNEEVMTDVDVDAQQALYFKIKQVPFKAGEYKGTLTFTANVA